MREGRVEAVGRRAAARELSSQGTPGQPPIIRTIVGLVSGIVATGPMTVAMIALHRRLPRGQRYALPPGEIVGTLADRTGASRHVSYRTRAAATLLSHFGYGGAAGAAYALATPALEERAAVKGAGVGMLLWGLSYFGWLPGAGILTPASQHPRERTALMIAAHAVWGLTLGTFAGLLASEADRFAPDSGPDVDR
jgi:hypothetical protein